MFHCIWNWRSLRSECTFAHSHEQCVKMPVILQPDNAWHGRSFYPCFFFSFNSSFNLHLSVVQKFTLAEEDIQKIQTEEDAQKMYNCIFFNEVCVKILATNCLLDFCFLIETYVAPNLENEIIYLQITHLTMFDKMCLCVCLIYICNSLQLQWLDLVIFFFLVFQWC